MATNRSAAAKKAWDTRGRGSKGTVKSAMAAVRKYKKGGGIDMTAWMKQKAKEGVNPFALVTHVHRRGGKRKEVGLLWRRR